MATALRRRLRHITYKVEFAALPSDFFQAAQKIVGIENGKTASAIGKRGEDLLVRRRGVWNVRNQRLRLSVRIVVAKRAVCYDRRRRRRRTRRRSSSSSAARTPATWITCATSATRTPATTTWG